MNKCTAKLILFFFMNINIFALPGMSSVTYDFSLNKGMFSSSALFCQNRKQKNIGLEKISEFMNQMNCNNLVDPDKFCNCVQAISSNGIQISDKDAKKIDLIIDRVAKDKVLESLAVKVEDMENYNDLISILASEHDGEKCFDKGIHDPTFGEYNSKLKNGKELTTHEELLGRIFKKIKKDINESDVLPVENVLSDAMYLKTLARNESITGAKKSLLESEVRFNMGLIKWDLFDDSPVSKLIRNDDNLQQILSDSMRNSYGFEATLGQISLTQTKVPKFLIGNEFDRTKFYSSDGGDIKIVNSAIKSACTKIKKDIEELVEKSNIDRNVMSIKAATFNPVTEEQIKTFKIIGENLSKKLESSVNSDDFEQVQEFIFNMDILYCKDRIISRNINNKENNSAEIDATKNKIFTNTVKLEIAMQDRDEKYNEFTSASDLLKKQSDKINRLRIRERLYEDILNGKNLGIVDGKVKIDLDDIELSRKAEKYAPRLYNLIVERRKKGIELELNTNDLVITRDAARDAIKWNEDQSNELGDRFVVADQDYRRSLDIVKNLKKGQAELRKELESKIGRRNTLVEIAKSTERAKVQLGLSSSFDDLLENEKRKIAKNITIKDLKPIINEEQTLKIENRPLSIASPLPNSAEETVGASTETMKTASNDNLFKSVNNVANIPAEIIKNRDLTKNRNEEIDNESLSKSRDNELERKIRELENLVANNKNKEVVENSDSSLDSKIDELKSKIEIEKIKAEKLKVSSELNQIKKNNVLAPVASVTQTSPNNTSVTDRLSAVQQRSPSSISKANSGTSGDLPSRSNFSSGSSSTSSQGSQISRSSNARGETQSFDGSRKISLNGVNTGKISTNGAIEISMFSENIDNSDKRLVKVDFNLNDENILNQESMLEALFVEGEKEIIIETLEGEKIIVKNNSEKIKKIKEDDSEIQSDKRKRKRRHKNLIELLKVGQTDSVL